MGRFRVRNQWPRATAAATSANNRTVSTSSDRSLGPPSHGNPVEPIKKRTDSFDRFSASCAVSSTVLDGADRRSVGGGCLLGRVNRLGELARPADIVRRRRPTRFGFAVGRTSLSVGGRGESSEFLVYRDYRV